MKRLKVYLETSVWNFYFADDAPERRDITREFYRSLKEEKFDIYISEVVIQEIERTPDPDRKEKLSLLIVEHNPLLLESDDSSEYLAERYMKASIFPADMENDAKHVAIATTNDLDALVSWNLQHIVRLFTIMKVNGINREEGYKEIEIRTPEEVMRNE